MKYLIFYGSHREGRLGINVAKYVKEMIDSREHDSEIIDSVDYDFGILKKKFSEYEDDAPSKMKELSEKMNAADGFILVSGEYNHSLQPGLTNLLSHFQKEYLHKPTGIVGYSPGNFAGARSAMQARAFMPEIGSITIPSILYFGEVHMLSQKLENYDNKSKLDAQTNSFLEELDWFADALKSKRENLECDC